VEDPRVGHTCYGARDDKTSLEYGLLMRTNLRNENGLFRRRLLTSLSTARALRGLPRDRSGCHQLWPPDVRPKKSDSETFRTRFEDLRPKQLVDMVSFE